MIQDKVVAKPLSVETCCALIQARKRRQTPPLEALRLVLSHAATHDDGKPGRRREVSASVGACHSTPETALHSDFPTYRFRRESSPAARSPGLVRTKVNYVGVKSKKIIVVLDILVKQY